MVNFDDTAPEGYRKISEGELMMKGDLWAVRRTKIQSWKPDTFCDIPPHRYESPYLRRDFDVVVVIRREEQNEW